MERVDLEKKVGPIFLSKVECNGTESRLLDCKYDSDTTKDSHDEDIGIYCQLCEFMIDNLTLFCL